MWPTVAILLVTAVSAPGDEFAPTVVVEQPPLVAAGWDAPPPPEAGGWDNPPPEAGMCDDGCGCPRPLGGLLAGPCVFDNYWNATGGRSPTDWIQGYGPECHLGTARLEWLMWFSKGRESPVLTRAFDASNRRIIEYPDEPIGRDLRQGARITVGRLLADEATWVEGRFWGLEDSSETFATDSIHTPIITRPFFNVATGLQSTEFVSLPGTASGSINILSKNDLIGADAWLRRVWRDDGYHRLSFLAGYQFTRLDDSLAISSASTSTGDPAVTGVPRGTLVNLQDSFRTQNEFHGGSLGLASNWRKRIFSVEMLGKIGLGDMRQTAIISGQTTTMIPGGAITTTPAGPLTPAFSIGSHTRHQFTYVPELNINGVVHFSPQWQFMVGYSIIYWNNVALAGNEINTRINPARFSFNRSDFWVQGISLGTEYRW